MCDQQIKVVLENGMELRLCPCPNSRVAFGLETRGPLEGSITDKVREAIKDRTFPLGCRVLQKANQIRFVSDDKAYPSRPTKGGTEKTPLLNKENGFYGWNSLEIKEIDWSPFRKPERTPNQTI